MDVTEAARTINKFERDVMWRKRLLALQDGFALTLLIGGLASAALILYVRLKPVQASVWMIVAGVFAVVLAAALGRWFLIRADERGASFLIDRALKLEDRMATAHAIIERNGPERLVEAAMIEDAADRIAGARAATIIPYKFPRWHALSLIAVIALVVAVMIPQTALPGGEAIAAERADIENAGERLEQAAIEVEQTAPAGSQTASLAKEQAELGRALRRSNDTRAEALKKLSALEARIRQRHDELASTRADEIVALADERLRPALSPATKNRSKPAEMSKDDPASLTEGDQQGDQQGAQNSAARQPESNGPEPAVAADSKKPKTASRKSEPESKSEASNQAETSAKNSEPRPDQSAAATGADAKSIGDKSPPRASTATKTANSEKASSQRGAQSKQRNAQSEIERQTRSSNESIEPQQAAPTTANASDAKLENQEQKPENDASNPLTDLVANQATKALPNLSDQLLNQAAQLRANQLSPENIRQLTQAAQLLARDLSKIAQSKEFQQAVEQLARQVNPEQLEEVARQLMNQEQLRQELEASARLLMQNQDVKQMVAGLAQTLNQIGEQIDKQRGGDNPDKLAPASNDRQAKGGENDLRQGKSGSRDNSRSQSEHANRSDTLAGRGQQSRLSGNARRVDGGQYLFLEAKPGAGAVRAPYSSAYPQYRREAERSVERSQVPARMRSMVRRYFDAINPDAGKQP